MSDGSISSVSNQVSQKCYISPDCSKRDAIMAAALVVISAIGAWYFSYFGIGGGLAPALSASISLIILSSTLAVLKYKASLPKIEVAKKLNLPSAEKNQTPPPLSTQTDSAKDVLSPRNIPSPTSPSTLSDSPRSPSNPSIAEKPTPAHTVSSSSAMDVEKSASADTANNNANVKQPSSEPSASSASAEPGKPASAHTTTSSTDSQTDNKSSSEPSASSATAEPGKPASAHATASSTKTDNKPSSEPSASSASAEPGKPNPGTKQIDKNGNGHGSDDDVYVVHNSGGVTPDKTGPGSPIATASKRASSPPPPLPPGLPPSHSAAASSTIMPPAALPPRAFKGKEKEAEPLQGPSQVSDVNALTKQQKTDLLVKILSEPNTPHSLGILKAIHEQIDFKAFNSRVNGEKQRGVVLEAVSTNPQALLHLITTNKNIVVWQVDTDGINPLRECITGLDEDQVKLFYAILDRPWEKQRLKNLVNAPDKGKEGVLDYAIVYFLEAKDDAEGKIQKTQLLAMIKKLIDEGAYVLNKKNFERAIANKELKDLSLKHPSVPSAAAATK